MAKRLSIADQVAMSAQEATPDFDPLPLALTLSLYRTMSAFDRVHADELAPVRLSVTQFNVLSVLLRVDEPLTMGELAQAVSVRSANLTAVTDSLVARGLVDRTLNPADRRSFLVSITPEGHQFMAGFLPGHWRVLQRSCPASPSPSAPPCSPCWKNCSAHCTTPSRPSRPPPRRTGQQRAGVEARTERRTDRAGWRATTAPGIG